MQDLLPVCFKLELLTKQYEDLESKIQRASD